MKRYPTLRPETILSWEYLQKVDAILKEGKRTAFVCTADEYALEIMKDQKRAKRKAPVDYGITGFDNIDTLAYVTPQLSTISNVVDEVAKSAVEMLFAMIDAEPEVEQNDRRQSADFTSSLPGGRDAVVTEGYSI